MSADNLTYTVTPEDVGYPANWREWLQGDEEVVGFGTKPQEGELVLATSNQRHHCPEAILNHPRIILRKKSIWEQIYYDVKDLSDPRMQALLKEDEEFEPELRVPGPREKYVACRDHAGVVFGICHGPSVSPTANGLRAIIRKKPKPTEEVRYFEKDLASLINRHNLEKDSGTPDFLLAAFLDDVRITLDDMIRKRDKWYGREEKEWANPTVEDAPPKKRYLKVPLDDSGDILVWHYDTKQECVRLIYNRHGAAYPAEIIEE